MEIAGLYVLAYLLGGVPTAFVLGKLVKGVDIRGYGSGNVGGSNVFYHVGKGWAVVVGVLEILGKGALPVYIGQYGLDLERSSPLLIGAPLLAIAGHNWSPYLRLQGGRGVGVVVGTLLALSPWVLLAFMGVALSGWAVTRSSGVWVLISLTLLPAWAVASRRPGCDKLLLCGVAGVSRGEAAAFQLDALPGGIAQAEGPVQQAVQGQGRGRPR